MGTFYEQGRGWRYDFRLFGHRYRAPRGFRTKKLSESAERALRDRLMAAHAGIPDYSGRAPSFTAAAGTAYRYAVERRKLRDPESFDRTLRKILVFWGDPPSDETKHIAGAPYHGLTLDAPLRDGSWLLKFEEWMSARKLAGSTKNHYRSACSRIYAVAMAPEFRAQTGVTLNPFRGIPRDPTRRRQSVFTRDQLRAILAAATPQLKLAIRIALLAPELRLGNIVALTWDQIDRELTWIRIAEHKTAGKTGRPLVTPIVPTLRTFLKAALPKTSGPVIRENGQAVSVKYIQQAFRTAVKAAGLVYGTQDGEVSFHTLRHTAATVMAEIGIPDAQRQEAIGHLALATTQGYTHMAPTTKIAPLLALAGELAKTLK